MEILKLSDFIRRLNQKPILDKYKDAKISVAVDRTNPNDEEEGVVQYVDLKLTNATKRGGFVMHRAEIQREAPCYTLPQLVGILQDFNYDIAATPANVSFVGLKNPFDRDETLDEPQPIGTRLNITHGVIGNYTLCMHLACET